MMKRFLALALVLALACATAVPGFAAGETTVTYTGSTLAVTGGDGATPTMSMGQMLPGVPSEGQMTLTNASGALARIYMSSEVTQTLEGSQSSGYRVKMWVEYEDGSQLVLFGNDGVADNGVQVGGGTGAGNQELEAMNDMLAKANGAAALAEGGETPENYLLVANLENGESAVLKLSITPDATATTNDYANKNGNINFKFMAENVDVQNRTEVSPVKGASTVVTQTRYWLNGVQTGDPVAVAPLAGVAAVALLVFIVAAKKKKEREE